MSGIPYILMAALSSPIPNAHPTLSTTPESSSSRCSMIPHPKSSIHLPPVNTSSSHEGWVKGKYADTHRCFTSNNFKFASLILSQKYEILTLTLSEKVPRQTDQHLLELDLKIFHSILTKQRKN